MSVLSLQLLQPRSSRKELIQMHSVLLSLGGQSGAVVGVGLPALMPTHSRASVNPSCLLKTAAGLFIKLGHTQTALRCVTKFDCAARSQKSGSSRAMFDWLVVSHLLSLPARRSRT